MSASNGQQVKEVSEVKEVNEDEVSAVTPVAREAGEYQSSYTNKGDLTEKEVWASVEEYYGKILASTAGKLH
jgi:hypothetical protein